MSEITEYSGAQTPPAPMPSFWEDVIEIFVHPVDVFRRRADRSFWPPFLFVVVVIGVIGIATFDSLQPMYEAEMTRQMAATNQKLTPEQVQQGMDLGMKVARFFLPIPIAFAVIVLGFVTWALSKLFGAKTTLSEAFAVVAWSYFPRIIGTIAASAQGLFMDPSSMTSAQAISLGPARFMDPATTNPVLFQLAGRFDLTILWETVLLAIGIYVTGKISKAAATWFGVAIFVVGSLMAIRQGFLLMK
jgi:hypothetical protein